MIEVTIAAPPPDEPVKKPRAPRRVPETMNARPKATAKANQIQKRNASNSPRSNTKSSA